MKISILKFCGTLVFCICAFSQLVEADERAVSTAVADESSQVAYGCWFDSSDGTSSSEYYMKTSATVLIYTESGHFVGKYSVYLCGGRKYIDFRNNWISIQGKSRFGNNGNWYIIKQS